MRNTEPELVQKVNDAVVEIKKYSMICNYYYIFECLTTGVVIWVATYPEDGDEVPTPPTSNSYVFARIEATDLYSERLKDVLNDGIMNRRRMM